jgi:hypothetical protein
MRLRLHPNQRNDLAKALVGATISDSDSDSPDRDGVLATDRSGVRLEWVGGAHDAALDAGGSARSTPRLESIGPSPAPRSTRLTP